MTITMNGVTVTDAALTQLVVRAAEHVDGVRVRRRTVDVGEDTVALSIGARYGLVLPELAREVQRNVTEAFSTMCDRELRAVDVTVEELE